MKNVINKETLWLCIVFLLIFFATKGQEKRMLTPSDYKLWNPLGYSGTSRNGEWIWYITKHHESQDTMYLQNIVNNRKYILPTLKWGTFSDNSKWFQYIKGDTVTLLNLDNGKKYQLNGFSNSLFISDGNFLLAYKDELKYKTLAIKNLKTLQTTTIAKVKQFSLDVEKKMLGVVLEEKGLNTVKYIRLDHSMSAAILTSGLNDYTGLTWNKSGSSLAFYESVVHGNDQPVVQKIHMYRNLKAKVKSQILDPLTDSRFPKGSALVASSLYISDDSDQLFFYLKKNAVSNKTKDENEQSDVIIWNSDDKKVPPVKNRPTDVMWYVWWIDGTILPIADKVHTEIILTGDQKHILIYSTDEYLPQHKFVGVYADFYVKDLRKGEQRLLLKKQNFDHDHVLVSPGGKYITYFKDRNWWVYDLYKDTHLCLTANINVSFENVGYDWAGVKPAYGSPGWFDDDSAVIIYDQFDVWLMTPDGSVKTKITDGRKKNISYRIYDIGFRVETPGGWAYFKALAYSYMKGLLFTTTNIENLNEGFSYWNKGSGLKILMEKPRKLEPRVDIDNNIAFDIHKPFLFTESDFDISPRLMLRYPSGKEKLISQSNVQQRDFYWGKSELINYKIAGGKQLKAALFYPANYNPAKKYPMVVHIYEKKAQYLHYYFSPKDNPEVGFNPAIYTAEGYFVMYPDIAYELNNPGISAARCVIAATQEIIDKGLVDKGRIGLMGYSFGGYETAFIVSKTDMFKTAISGAGLHDLLDYYLSVSPVGSNIWRFENQQQRIQTPFYGPDFDRNSTIRHVQDIKTPLLLFTGDQDTQVDWQQSRKLHIALWRLGKESTLILYPGDAHGGFNEPHTKDISMRTKNWFDHYLKSEKAADWMHVNEEIKKE